MILEGGVVVQTDRDSLIVNGDKCFSLWYAQERFKNHIEHYETLNYLVRNGALWVE